MQNQHNLRAMSHPIPESTLLKHVLFDRLSARFMIVAMGLAAAVAGVVSPFFQKAFIDQISHQPLVAHDNLFLVRLGEINIYGLILISVVAALLQQGLILGANYIGFREATIIQRRISEWLYQKTLRIRPDQMGSSTVGEIVSLYATDVPGSTAMIDQALPTGASILFPLILAPLAVNWVCDIPIGYAVAVIVVTSILNVCLATRQSRFFYFYKALAAERVGLVNEWVQNIRPLRILGWMQAYEKRIFRKREEETRNRVRMVTNGQIMNSFGSSMTYVINLAGVGALIFLRPAAVTPGDLFALLWIFGVFLTRPFRQVPWIFTFAFDSLTSLRRIQEFLHRPSNKVELVSETISESMNEPVNDSGRGLSASLDGLDLEVANLSLVAGEKQILFNIDFSVKQGEFVAVIGEVGCGKTSLIHSLMRETGANFALYRLGDRDARSMPLPDLRRYFSFVPQEGFVMSSSLKENVAFDYEPGVRSDESDEQKNWSTREKGLRASLKLAQFDLDVEQLSDGLETSIGERGVNLSGGQKQRVSLARAHYYDRPVVLLDDCLSALDVDTEEKLVDRLLLGAWRQKTRILVTHRLSVLAKVDRILFMEDGRIVEQGTFRSLMKKSARMRTYVASLLKSEVVQGTNGSAIDLTEGSMGETSEGLS